MSEQEKERKKKRSNFFRVDAPFRCERVIESFSNV